MLLHASQLLGVQSHHPEWKCICDFTDRKEVPKLPPHHVLPRLNPAWKRALGQKRELIQNAKGFSDQFLCLAFHQKAEKEGPQGKIKIALKYNPRTKMSAIEKIVRISKPGLRKYVGSDNLPRVINGLGIAILSTSKGVITDKEARKLKIGGEVLCYVY